MINYIVITLSLATIALSAWTIHSSRRNLAEVRREVARSTSPDPTRAQVGTKADLLGIRSTLGRPACGVCGEVCRAYDEPSPSERHRNYLERGL